MLVHVDTNTRAVLYFTFILALAALFSILVACVYSDLARNIRLSVFAVVSLEQANLRT
jgi:hypothetical protein